MNAGTSDSRVGAISTHIYAAPGTSVFFEVHRDNGATGEVDMTLSGFLLAVKL